jgi:hypothetical protein
MVEKIVPKALHAHLTDAPRSDWKHRSKLAEAMGSADIDLWRNK